MRVCACERVLSVSALLPTLMGAGHTPLVCAHVVGAAEEASWVHREACAGRPVWRCDDGGRSRGKCARVVRAQEAKEFAEQNQMAMFIETSAKTADNINELFTSIARRYGSGTIAPAGGVTEEASA